MFQRPASPIGRSNKGSQQKNLEKATSLYLQGAKGQLDDAQSINPEQAQEGQKGQTGLALKD